MAPSIRVFNEGGDNSLKEKITTAIKQIEVQRKELDQLRFRLDQRRKSIFNSTVRSFERGDEMRARLLANEHYELQKITRVVNASELALLHIVVRLETLRDVGDVMYVLTSAFKAVRKIGKSISEVAPNLERASEEINQSFSNILSELGVISPSVNIALTDTPQEIFDKAQQLISEKTSELSELPKAINESDGSEEPSIFEKTKRIALLATEEEDEEGNLIFGRDDPSGFGPVLFNPADSTKIDPETAVRRYVREFGQDGKIDVTLASVKLNLPVDKIEQSYLKILSEDNFDNQSKEFSPSISKKKESELRETSDT